MNDLAETVRAAQRGDPDAFTSLVHHFQDIAFAAALSRVGDPQLAQDVAQEAFLQAHRDLPTLREPHAFAFWFRKIIAKHADRMRRGKHLTTVSLDNASDARDYAKTPAEAAESSELTALIRAEIGRLPERERIVVSLYYVADRPQDEIATFLEVPPSTIKKRLHDARRRLKERMMSSFGDNLREQRPSRDERFAHRIQFLVAVRTGDVASVERQLQADPSLISATLSGEDWGRAEMGRATIPMEFNYTPIHFAANYSQHDLAEVLLRYGANVNADDPKETPLGRAVVMRDRAMVDLLLRHGADPNLAPLNGITPLHRAAMRGSADLVESLLEHHADAHARDAFGRTPLDWAVLNHWPEVASLLGGTAADGVAAAPAAGGPLLETGIKVLDVFAPLPRGGTVRTTAQGGVGKMVLLAEIVLRLARRGGRGVYVRWEERFYRVAEADREQREMGVDQVSTLVLGRMSDGAADRERTLLEGVAAAERLRDADGGRDVLLLIDAPPTAELPLEQVRSRVGVRGNGSITLLVFDLLLPNTGYVSAPLGPQEWDVQLAFDVKLAKRVIFPAVDVLASSSRLVTGDAPVAAAAREVLRTDPDSLRADQLRRFQSQPFFGAEPWTARPGQMVPRADAVAGYAAILEGAADRLSDRELLWTGALPVA